MALTLHRLTLLWIFLGATAAAVGNHLTNALGMQFSNGLESSLLLIPAAWLPTSSIRNQEVPTPISCVLRGSTRRALSAPRVPPGWGWVEDTEQPRSVNLDHAPTPPASSTQQHHLYSLRRGGNRFLPLKAAVWETKSHCLGFEKCLQKKKYPEGIQLGQCFNVMDYLQGQGRIYAECNSSWVLWLQNSGECWMVELVANIFNPSLWPKYLEILFYPIA